MVASSVRALPSNSGDRLNFLADALAVLGLLGLARSKQLPPDYVFPAFGLLLIFFLICFIGTALMRILQRQGI